MRLDTSIAFLKFAALLHEGLSPNPRRPGPAPRCSFPPHERACAAYRRQPTRRRPCSLVPRVPLSYDALRWLSIFRFWEEFGAVEWIRTTTVLLPPAPQAGASASSATTARRKGFHCIRTGKKRQGGPLECGRPNAPSGATRTLRLCRCRRSRLLRRRRLWLRRRGRRAHWSWFRRGRRGLRKLLQDRSALLHAAVYANYQRHRAHHEHHRAPCGCLRQHRSSSSRTERRLAARPAESSREIRRLAALQQHYDDQHQAVQHEKSGQQPRCPAKPDHNNPKTYGQRDRPSHPTWHFLHLTPKNFLKNFRLIPSGASNVLFSLRSDAFTAANPSQCTRTTSPPDSLHQPARHPVLPAPSTPEYCRA